MQRETFREKFPSALLSKAFPAKKGGPLFHRPLPAAGFCAGSRARLCGGGQGETDNAFFFLFCLRDGSRAREKFSPAFFKRRHGRIKRIRYLRLFCALPSLRKRKLQGCILTEERRGEEPCKHCPGEEPRKTSSGRGTPSFFSCFFRQNVVQYCENAKKTVSEV